MATIQCPNCGGKGYNMKPKQEVYTDTDGKQKSRTVMVDERCNRCSGMGSVQG